MTLKQIFIRNLKDLRKKEGISQMNLALYCDISPGYIGEIESGRKFPSTELIEKIAFTLRVEPYLFFKDQKSSSLSSDTSLLPPLPYKIKKQIKIKLKEQITAQVKTQITSQVNLSVKEILNDIYKILDNN